MEQSPALGDAQIAAGQNHDAVGALILVLKLARYAGCEQHEAKHAERSRRPSQTQHCSRRPTHRRFRAISNEAATRLKPAAHGQDYLGIRIRQIAPVGRRYADIV